MLDEVVLRAVVKVSNQVILLICLCGGEGAMGAGRFVSNRAGSSMAEVTLIVIAVEYFEAFTFVMSDLPWTSPSVSLF